MPQAAIAAAAWVGSQVAFAVAALPVSMGVAAAAGFTAMGATIAAEVYAVAELAKAATPKIKDPGAAQRWQADPRAGIPYPTGRCAVAGNIVFNQSSPADSRKFLNFVTVYSGVPSDGFEDFQFNGVTEPFNADGGEGASGYYLNRMWLKTQLGDAVTWLRWTATNSKDTPANHGGMPTEWTQAHKLTGYTASLLAFEYDPKRFSAGVPSPRAVGRWAKTYDPRQDSTYPGGSGTHRWGDETTWTWSRCPYRNALTWAIGRRNNGVLVLGYGYAKDEVDIASFVYGMNVSDANGWTMGGLSDSLDDPWEVLKAFCQAGAGYPILGGTQLSVMVNAPAVSVATITEADIVGAMTVPALVSADERINTVWPSYTEELLDWQVVTPDAPVQVAEYVALDGEERSIPLGLPMVQKAKQAGQISRYAIEDARELSGIVLGCKPWTQWIGPGLCVTANIPSAGLNGQKLRIQRRTRDPSSMVVTFIARTETDGKHAFALGQTNTPPATPSLTIPQGVIVPAPTVGSWSISAGKIESAGGTLPAIVIEGAIDAYDAGSIVVEYREIAPLVGKWQSKPFPPSGTKLTVDGVMPGATYEVRLHYITVTGQESAERYLDLGTITVSAVRPEAAVLQSIADAQANVSAAVTALNAEITRAKGAEDTLRASIVSLTSTVSGNTSAISAEALARSTETSALSASLSSLSTTVGNNKASADSSIATLTTQQSSTAASLSSLSTTVGSNKAAADSSIATLTTQQSSTASSLSSLSATVSGNTASISTQALALADLSGKLTAYLKFTAAAGGNEAYATLVAGADGSLIDLRAKRIRLGDANTTVLEIVGGAAKLTNVEVSGGLVVHGSIKAPQLAQGAGVQPAYAYTNSPLTGTGAEVIALTLWVDLAEARTIEANCAVSMAFPSGDQAWSVALYIDGWKVWNPSGARSIDCIPLVGQRYCEAGPRAIRLFFTANNKVTLREQNISVKGIY